MNDLVGLPSAGGSVPPPERLDQGRLGSMALDQWRGLALLAVLISHGLHFTGCVEGFGRVGVNLFFFISGVLVFRSLSSRRTVTAWQRTRSFWWRRFRRLYPALVTYTVAMLGVTWWTQHIPNLPPGSDFKSYWKMLPLAFGCVINYVQGQPLAMHHLWSLACEIQFYFIAPIFYWLGGNSPGRRNAVFGTLLVVLLGLGLSQPLVGRGELHFEFGVWPMMLGFYCECKRARFEKLPEKLVRMVLWLSGGICGASMVLMLFGRSFHLLVVGVGSLLLMPCYVAYVAGRPMSGLPGRWARWLGERTYSIYLWQQPFTICEFLPPWLHPAGAAVSVAVGAVWFHVFERPFLSTSRRRSL